MVVQRDRKVAGSTTGQGTIKSTRSTQSSIPPGWVNRVPACMAGVKAGHVRLCRVEGNTVIPYGKRHPVAVRWCVNNKHYRGPFLTDVSSFYHNQERRHTWSG